MLRKSVLGSLVGLMVVGGTAYAERVKVPVEALLAPSVGYEAKNNIQVVLYGVLPNSCYTLDGTSIERDSAKNSLKVTQYAFRDRKGVCAQDATLPPHMASISPFTNVVNVGRLAVGDFLFTFDVVGGKEAERVINVASDVTPTVDSMPYATISNAAVPDVINGTQNLEVTVQGVLTSTCDDLNEEVKIMKEQDVFVVLPTVKQKLNIFCAQVLIPFEKKINLGKAAPGLYLVHTRSKNGQSLNHVVQVAK